MKGLEKCESNEKKKMKNCNQPFKKGDSTRKNKEKKKKKEKWKRNREAGVLGN